MAKIERWYQTAFRLQTAGDLDAAEPLYRRVLEKQPRHAEALYLLGSLYAQQSRYADALPLLDRALAVKPQFTEAFNNRAVALKELGRLDEALAAYDAAIARRPGYAEAHNNRGITLQALGRWEEAAESYRQAHAANPAYIEPLNNLGIVLKDKKLLAESEAAFRQALAADPAATDPLNNLGLTLMAQARFEEAIACHDSALALRPNFPQALNSRGASLVALGRFAEARDGYARALEMKPDYTDARCNVALSFLSENRLGEALAAFDDVLQRSPDHLSALWNRALTLLVGGGFARGWAEYECRFRHNRVSAHLSPKPRWDGTPLAGRTILVYAEQGFGDTLHFVRLLPRVRAGGGRVLFECPPALHPLLVGCDGVDTLLTAPAPGEDHLEPYDLQIPLLSLPGLFGITEDTIPDAVPYVTVPADRRAAWHARLAEIGASLGPAGAGLKVGLVWGGSPHHTNDHNRSCALAEFAPLAAVPGVTFFSLQKGPVAAQAADPPRGMTLVDLGPVLTDFADTAAVVAQMDLVVSVDTSVVHLAGALGTPVWTLLPFCPDWRWQLDRQDSPWYPSMRLFRQSRPREWASVLRRVGEELERLAAQGPAAAQRIPAEEQAAHLIKRGETCFAAGDHTEARRCFEQALAVAPGHTRALNNLSVLAFHEGRHDDAIRTLDALLAQAPGQASALENMARCWEAKGDDARASAWWRQAVEVSPDSAPLWNSLAQCAIRRQGWSDARDAFRRSEAISPAQDGVRELLAELDAVLGAETGIDHSTPLVSIITPCYKQAHLLPEAVASVVGQTYTHWEMVIVNDGSPDDTSAVAQALIAAHPDCSIRLIEKDNGGLSAARNTGIGAARGALLLPLDSDDKLHPQMLEKTVRALQEHPECSVAFTHTQHFGLRHSVWNNGPFTLAQECEDNNIPYCSLMRRGLAEALGGYSADVHAYEDWDFWLRALTQGHQGVLVPEPLFCYRLSADSKLQQDNHQRERFVALLVLRHPGIYPAGRLALAEETLRGAQAERERFAAALGGPVGRGGRPRALIAVDQFFPSVGGSERLAEEVGASLQQAGWEVEVATSPHPGRREDTHRGIRIHSCGGDIGERLRQIVSTRHCDAVVALANTNSLFLAAAGRLPAPHPRLILVPCINAFDFEWAQQDPLKKAGLGDLLGRADAVVCSSRDGYDARLLSELGVASTYVPNAVRRVTPSREGFRREHGLADDKPLLLVVGNHWREKNHAGLLHALRDEPGEWRMVIIGHPAPQHPHIIDHTRQIAALDPRVTLVPGVPPETIAAAMTEADLLLLPSIAEASPLVLLEAMSHRLPWLATPTCGSAPDHAGGLVLPLERFAPAIRFLLGASDARRALGDAGQAHWHAAYTWDVVGPRYAALAAATEMPPPLEGQAEALQATQAVADRFGQGHPAATDGPGTETAISVVISTYNRVDLLRRVLKSYETQTLPRWAYEVVVVDDGSSDGTARFLKSYRPDYRLVVHRQPQNRGLSAARNQGILRAQGGIIVFQDDDDLATPDYLEQHLRSHQANPAQNIGVFGRIEASPMVADSVNFQIMNGAPGLYNYFDDIADGQILDFRHFWMNVVSVKTSLLRQFGFFDEETRWGLDDAELGWRLRAQGLRLVANRDARLQALRSISLTQFCSRQSKIGGAAAWMSRKHSDPKIAFWLNIANAEQRLPALKEAWEKARSIVGTLDVMEKAGWSAAARQPGFRQTTFPALADLCRIAGEYHYLSGYLGRLAEYAAQDRLAAPPPPGGPLVSVVVTSYNYGRYLAETVESVVAQTYTDWEMIIVNDGSPDDTRQVAEALIAAHPGRRIRLINQPNSGHAAHARNRGLAGADGAYLLCLDADDVLEPTFLAESVALLEANPRLSIAYTDQVRFYADGTAERFFAGDYALEHLTQYLPFGACSLFRRSAWVEAGPYKPVGYEDWDFWLSCAERSHIGRRIPKPLFRYRKHNEGKYAQDVARGLTHKAWLVHNHPALFDGTAQRWARGIVAADKWLALPDRPGPTALVTVLMTLGRGDDAAPSLASLAGQTYGNWELILLPTDRQDVSPALRALAGDARVTVLTSDGASSTGEALNRGLRAAQGRYVAYLPGGTAWEPGHLRTVAGFLEGTGEHAAYADTVETPAPHFDHKKILAGNLVPRAGMVHERACLERTGPFDPALPAHADWDLWIRLSRFFDVLRLPVATSRDGVPAAGPAAAERDALETIYARYAAAAHGDAPLQAAQQAVLRQAQERAERDDAYEQGLEEAERRVGAGDGAGAKTLLRHLLKDAPGDTRALNDLGVILWQEGAHQQALHHFLQALQAGPDDRVTVLNCADALCSLGLPEDAGLLLEGFVRRHPDDAEAARMRERLAAQPAARRAAA